MSNIVPFRTKQELLMQLNEENDRLRQQEPAIFVHQPDEAVTGEGYEPGSLVFFAVLAAFYGAVIGYLYAEYKGLV